MASKYSATLRTSQNMSLAIAAWSSAMVTGQTAKHKHSYSTWSTSSSQQQTAVSDKQWKGWKLCYTPLSSICVPQQLLQGRSSAELWEFPLLQKNWRTRNILVLKLLVPLVSRQNLKSQCLSMLQSQPGRKRQLCMHTWTRS